NGDDAALFSHPPLSLEEADATAAAIAVAAARCHDADAAVVFEHCLLDVAELVHAVFTDGHLDVGDAEAFLLQRRLADLAILDDDGRRRIDQRIEPGPPAAHP